MDFYTNSKDKRLQIIVKKAGSMLFNDEFRKKLWEWKSFHPGYTSPNVTGYYVWQRLKEGREVIEIRTYKSWNPFTSANGYTKNDGKLIVFLNTRKFNRSDASILATILHEAVHEADNNDRLDTWYHHGDNKPKGGTAPEVVADIAYEVESGFVSEVSSAI